MAEESPKSNRELDELGPATLSTRGIPTERRGYDKKAVDALIALSVERWSELDRRYRVLMDEVDKVGGADHLVRDMGAIGAEVGAILTAANEAADSLRQRARDDADRVLTMAAEESEATATAAADEANRLTKEADAAAFEVRKAAWEHSVAMVDSAVALSARLVADARSEQLRSRADGEREAHRRVAATRKEGEDTVRAARFEAEQMLARANRLAADMLERAELGLDADLETTDRRRRLAMTDIELLQAEQSIADVSVLPAEQAPEVVPSPATLIPELSNDSIEMVFDRSPHADLGESLVSEVEQLRARLVPSAGPETEVSDHKSVGRIRRPPSDIGTLFDALRSTAEHDVIDSGGHDEPIASRDRRLMGIHNAALRDMKRRISDIQDRALEGLAAGTWSAASESIGSDVITLLAPYVTRACAAGADAARELVGGDPGPAADARARSMINSMTGELASQLRASLASGGGPDATIAAVRKVLRSWRVDEAERWVATVLIAAYHDTMLGSLIAGGFASFRGVASGTRCENCLGASAVEWEAIDPPAGMLTPPVDSYCRCSFTVARRQ